MPRSASQKTSASQNKKDRVTSILQAAREVFEQEGYENAKMTEIATKVGVVEGTVFHYFGSKKLLMARIIEEFYKEITEDLGSGLVGVEGTRNRLHYIIRFHLGIVTRNSRLCGEILRESRGLDGELAQAVSELNRSYTQCLADVVTQGVELGDIAAGTSVSMVRNTVYGSIEHTLWTLIGDQRKIDVDAEAGALTALVYNGIAATDGEEKSEIAALARKLNKLIDDR